MAIQPTRSIEGAVDLTRPRILVTQEDFDRAEQLLETDEYVGSWHDQLTDQLSTVDDANPLTDVDYEALERDGLDRFRTNTSRIAMLAYAYRMTGEDRYAETLWTACQELAGKSRWVAHPQNPDLGTAEATQGMAIAYDWLYDYWSDDQRTTIRDAIVENGLAPMDEPFNGGGNWTAVVNGGIVNGALAVLGDPSVDSIARETIRMTRNSMLGGNHSEGENPIEDYGDRGAYPEGPTYWGYASRYLTFYLASTYNALGHVHGLLDHPKVRHYGDFPPAITGPAGVLNYGSSSQGTINAPQLHWLAKQFDEPGLGEFQRWVVGKGNRIAPDNRSETGVMGGFNDRGVLQILWYDPDYVSAASFDRDYVDREAPIATHRSNWDLDDSTLWIGLVGVSPTAGHAQMDVGSFCLDALGTRWATDLGTPSRRPPAGGDHWYDFYRDRWDYYENRPEGHNTLTVLHSVSPENYKHHGGMPSQARHASGRIVASDQTDGGAFTRMDLSSAYAADSWSTSVQSIERGIALTHGRSRALVQDELVFGTRPALEAETYWFMHTRAEVESNGRTAMLQRDGERLQARLLAPDDAEFTVRDAEPLPESPDPEQASHDGVQKLTVHRPRRGGHDRIAVEFVPLPGEQSPPEVPEPRPLDEWDADELA
ncbi:heparinase II/III domain-containing protein [Salinarchaeum laminariae]|uniref:heparinase II/III domain-containing protein n=1 Tax=Salinarchaeum laminariae TaxID=869888 RepID=UPI0020C0DB5A|nr:heparinase II/III family protein [Salinarchaeum laminariae]